MVVVLPAPLGPRKPRISPFFHAKRDAIDRGETAIALGEVLHLNHGLHSVSPATGAGGAGAFEMA